MQLPDGQWAYYPHDPGLRIPPRVDERLPPSKQLEVVYERSITVRFVPHGNPRKILDITVVLVPDQNPEGLFGWNVWKEWGSKKAFIAFTNSHVAGSSSPPVQHKGSIVGSVVARGLASGFKAPRLANTDPPRKFPPESVCRGIRCETWGIVPLSRVHSHTA